MAKSAANHDSNVRQKPTTFKPLTIAMENAIESLMSGSTDAETAAAVGVVRTTISEWRHNPLFVATLNARRAEMWRAPHDRLQSLAMKAVENVATAINGGDLRASLELLKLLKGGVEPTGETDPVKIMREEVAAQLDRDFPQDNDVMREFLIDQARPGSYKRKQELEAEYREHYLE